MSDKEPRRRKKRKDGQKKDDLNFEDTQSTQHKTQDNWQKDLDQEAEEEVVVIHHEPSAIAKIIFFILFSLLIAAVGTIFISLSGADRGPVDVFDSGHGVNLHTEGPEVLFEHSEEHESIPSESEEESVEVLESWKEKLDELTETTDDVIEEVEPVLETTTWPEDTTEESVNYEEYEPELQAVNKDTPSESPEDEPHDTQTAEDEEPLIVDIYSEDKVFEDSNYIQSSEELRHQEQESSSWSSQTEEIVSSTTQPFETASEVIKEETSSIKETQTVGETDEEESEKDVATEPPYEKSDITNEEDFHIKETLDEIDRILDRSPEKALQKYESLLKQHPNSPRACYGKAAALDRLAEKERNNKRLEQAIEGYMALLELRNVPDKLFLLSGKRSADRMRFRGFHTKAIQLQLLLAGKFPNNADVKNQLAVSYLLVGQNKEAKSTLKKVLQIEPDNGFAKVHLGFILKTEDKNYPEAIKYMSEGIASRQPGVIDGRFFFHLGDALARSGFQNEAMAVYEQGVVEGLFLSAYQRSLYNVKGLTGQPWWETAKIPFSDSLLLLEKNWEVIKKEALNLVNSERSGFIPESEGLQDTGEWQQFELFARGRKMERNCEKTPYTCSLVEKFPDAAGCKRGQIKFSIMQPGTHVWAHTGPTNCRLRTHLGLVVPEGVSIRVANITRGWKEGKVIIFDDSFEHEVWHKGDSFRLILIVDFWHPELTPYQKATLSPI